MLGLSHVRSLPFNNHWDDITPVVSYLIFLTLKSAQPHLRNKIGHTDFIEYMLTRCIMWPFETTGVCNDQRCDGHEADGDFGERWCEVETGASFTNKLRRDPRDARRSINSSSISRRHNSSTFPHPLPRYNYVWVRQTDRQTDRQRRMHTYIAYTHTYMHTLLPLGSSSSRAGPKCMWSF